MNIIAIWNPPPSGRRTREEKFHRLSYPVITRNLQPFRHFSLRPDVLFGVFFQDRRSRREAAPTVSVRRMAFPVTLTLFGAPTFSAVPALFGLCLKSSAETGRPRREENADLTANPRRANPESARNSGSPTGISEHLTAVPFTDNRTRPRLRLVSPFLPTNGGATRSISV